MAHELGVTHGYLLQLQSGSRDTRNISRAFARACATYLGTSTVNVLLAAGAMDVGDFSIGGSPERRVRVGLRALLDDPQVGALVDEEALLSAPADVQELLVRLYEEAIGSEVIPSHGLPPLLQSSLRLAVAYAAEDVSAEESSA